MNIGKKSCVILSEDFIGYLVIDWLAPSCDWLTPRHVGIITILSCIYISSVASLFSVVSLESKLVSGLAVSEAL